MLNVTKDDRKTQRYTGEWLAAQAGISRRNIYYYVKEGLLPPPRGSGRRARYTEEHYLRLMIIQHLKERTSWRLEGIAEFLDAMTLEAMREFVAELGGTLPPPTADPDDVPTMAPRGIVRMKGGMPPIRGIARRVLGRSGRASEPTEDSDSEPVYLHMKDLDAEEPLEEVPGTDTWERVRITDAVEIHYKPGDGSMMRRILTLIALARRMFSK